MSDNIERLQSLNWNHTKPYKIIDCIEGLKTIPDKSIALVITDPPYNVGLDYGEETDDERDRMVYARWCNKWFAECRRVAENVVITPGVKNIYIYPEADWIAAWYKHGSPSRNIVGFNAWEPILIYGHRKATERTDFFDATLETDPNAEGHPCPKPVKLWRELITHFSNPDDIVLDIFLGSGTSILASRMTGRVGIGFEVNPYYEPIIQRRILEKYSSLESYFEMDNSVSTKSTDSGDV